MREERLSCTELVALQVADISWRASGILLHIGRSKTDQEGEGTDLPVPNGGHLRPVAAAQGLARGVRDPGGTDLP